FLFERSSSRFRRSSSFCRMSCECSLLYLVSIPALSSIDAALVASHSRQASRALESVGRSRAQAPASRHLGARCGSLDLARRHRPFTHRVASDRYLSSTRASAASLASKHTRCRSRDLAKWGAHATYAAHTLRNAEVPFT